MQVYAPDLESHRDQLQGRMAQFLACNYRGFVNPLLLACHSRDSDNRSYANARKNASRGEAKPLNNMPPARAVIESSIICRLQPRGEVATRMRCHFPPGLHAHASSRPPSSPWLRYAVGTAVSCCLRWRTSTGWCFQSLQSRCHRGGASAARSNPPRVTWPFQTRPNRWKSCVIHRRRRGPYLQHTHSAVRC